MFTLLEYSRAARVRRGESDRYGYGAIAIAALGALIAIGLGADTLNVEGEDVGGLGLGLILWSFVSVIPIVFVALALVAVILSLFQSRDRWRRWLDRTLPIALTALIVIAIPVLYGFVLVHGGDATLC
jgi:hypothetical protein